MMRSILAGREKDGATEIGLIIRISSIVDKSLTASSTPLGLMTAAAFPVVWKETIYAPIPPRSDKRSRRP